MLVWPDRAAVMREARVWAQTAAAVQPEVVRIGYFGSYARDQAGVGSDLDLVAIVRRTDEPFSARAAAWPVERLPVPADLLVYSEEEWNRLVQTDTRFAHVLRSDVIWLWPDAAPDESDTR